MNLRGRLVVPLADVSGTRVGERHELETLIDHRSAGIGAHRGREHPNRRRVGNTTVVASPATSSAQS